MSSAKVRSLDFGIPGQPFFSRRLERLLSKGWRMSTLFTQQSYSHKGR